MKTKINRGGQSRSVFHLTVHAEDSDAGPVTASDGSSQFHRWFTLVSLWDEPGHGSGIPVRLKLTNEQIERIERARARALKGL